LNQDVEKLWELQTVLSQLGDREKQLTNKPESFAAVDREWQNVNAEMERLQAQIEQHSKERRRVDGELTDQQELLKKYQGQLMQVKNQQQYAAAWKEMFDGYLAERAKRTGRPFVPFDKGSDYDRYVDGKPRADGTRSFLESRGISVPEGTADDPPGAETINGLGNRKNELVLTLIKEQGVEPYEGSIRYAEAARRAGLRRAVVSSSANCRDVLTSAGIGDLVEVIIDGVVAQRDQLHGKPAPDTFLAGARALGVQPAQAAVLEDALAGVEAGRAGHFGFVVGVDRVGQAAALREHGADIVITDLAQLVEES